MTGLVQEDSSHWQGQAEFLSASEDVSRPIQGETFPETGSAASSPSFLEQYYYSNHFIWDNTAFEKKKVAKAQLGFLIPKRKFNIELAYAQLNNYIYFDSLAPVQLKSGLNVLSVKAQKEFKLGVFHSLNKFVWQSADNANAVSIPEISSFFPSVNT